MENEEKKCEISYPFNWIKPGERQYDASGFHIIKGKYSTPVLAFIRRYILRKPPIFWMKK